MIQAGALIRPAEPADVDVLHRFNPDRVKFKRTVRIVRRRAADQAAFPP